MADYIEKEIKEEILDRVDLQEFLARHAGLHAHGRELVADCPLCHEEEALKYDKKKKLYKCFKCGWGGNGAVKYLQEAEKLTFPDAMQVLSQETGIAIPNVPRKAGRNDRPRTVAADKSYKNKQLEASGLTPRDVLVNEHSTADGVETITTKEAFRAATLNRFDDIVSGDDMVILYYDLYGRPVQFYREKDSKPHYFYRVRWQNPESHPLRDGSCPKYRTPVGAGLQLYIPEQIRTLYNRATETPRLFFTEGEKKAEKCCKHGMPAFGMAGINCLVGKDREFPESVIQFVERCKVREICFIMDSDWDDLSDNLTPDKDVRTRPRNFFYAARRFRDWMQTLRGRKLFIDTYLILGATPDEKGIDDLLAGSMKGHESDYAAEVEEAINGQVQTNDYAHFHIYKISAMPDTRLAELWHLNSIDDFIDHHRPRLSGMYEFLWGRNKWRLGEDGAKELAQPLMADEIFWHETLSNDGQRVVKTAFSYTNSLRFFMRRGFFRYRLPNNDFKFVRIENNRVSEINSYVARDFAMDMAKNLCREETLDMLLRGAKMYFGQDQLSNIDYCKPDFIRPRMDSEVLLFGNAFVRVTAGAIESKPLDQITENYWSEQVRDFEFHRTKEPLFRISRDGDDFVFKTTDTGDKCEFATFLFETGLFGWEKYLDEERNHDPANPLPTNVIHEAERHMISKMSAIGYLLHRYRDESTCRAVIGMDGKMSEVGESNGGSGKSLLGNAIGHMLKQTKLDGKKIDIKGDPFVWESVDETTRNIFVDDVAVNFDFEMLYPLITGDMEINAKGVSKYSLSGDKVPKIYLTTNHAINGMSGSSERRQFKLAFCDFFDADFQPRMQFGHNFFDRYWEEEQWNLFYNFMIECLQLYLVAQQNHWGIAESGLIPAPTANLEKRQLRQEMGEAFFEFMNEWLGIDEYYRDGDAVHYGHLNAEWPRVECQNKYLEENPKERRYYSPQRFWKKLLLYCKYYGFRMNPRESKGHTTVQHSKSNGVEMITIANRAYEQRTGGDIPY